MAPDKAKRGSAISPHSSINRECLTHIKVNPVPKQSVFLIRLGTALKSPHLQLPGNWLLTFDFFVKCCLLWCQIGHFQIKVIVLQCWGPRVKRHRWVLGVLVAKDTYVPSLLQLHINLPFNLIWFPTQQATLRCFYKIIIFILFAYF